MEKIDTEVGKIHERMTEHDQSDFEGLQKFTYEMSAMKQESDQLEERWLELSAQTE